MFVYDIMNDVRENFKHGRYCKKILILYRLRILALASTVYKNESIVEQQFT